ncbi:MAG: hypothetical protein OIF55_04095 [Amphritea sp.]|nr:hypothetical protein [Amphritea sp.]
MIIKTSSMHMSAEHEKSEFRAVSSTLDGEALSNSFGFQLQEIQLSNQLSRLEMMAGVANTGSSGISFGLAQASSLQFSSALLVTGQGARFEPLGTLDSTSGSHSQEGVTRARLWQSLLNAIQPDNPPLVDVDELIAPQQQAVPTDQTQQPELKPVSLQMAFRVSETVEEYEHCSFNSCGKVTTADGRSIDFDLNLTMERSYSATREYEVTQEVVFTDPLILNFEGNYADLSDEKFEFDLDADGNTELISYLTGSSGMLALDRNNDGIINDGSELFGALTGNGFAELAANDEDGNGYIDEADSIFDQLMIWNKTRDGDSLESLKDRDIGAIYLGSTETPFEIKGEDNQHNGRVKSSGVYFTEAGEVGTLQQIDMVV